MGTTYPTRTRASQSVYRIVIPILVALSLLAAQMVPFSSLLSAARAGVEDNTDPFEIDGNAVSDGGLDWANASDVQFHMDKFDTPEDDVFKSGSKENSPGNWSFESKQVSPGKSDLVRSFATAGLLNDTDPMVYFGFEIFDPGPKPSFSGNFEFNQADLDDPNDVTTHTVNGETLTIPKRQVDDLLFTVDWSPSDVKILSFTWDGSKWVQLSDVAGSAAVNTAGSVTLPASIGGGTAGQDRFIEVAVDLSRFFEDEDNPPCLTFGSSWVKSRTSGADSNLTATLVDVIAPLRVSIDFCGDVTLRKVDDLSGDDGPNGLSGATLIFYEGTDTSETGTVAYGPCTTGTDGYCTGTDSQGRTLTDLHPGQYTAVELAPPAGYKLSSPNHQVVDLEAFGEEHIVFSNPPVNYLIDVDPDGDNAVGNAHDFEVTLLTDYVFDQDSGTADESDDDPDLPVEGETVALSWDGPGDVKVWDDDTTESSWEDIAPVADPTNFSCATDVDGTCDVRVISFDPDQGTLTGSYDLTGVYQHTTGEAAANPADATSDVPVDSITDTADKAWHGFRVELAPAAANNPLGVDHEFTATVYRVFPDGDGLDEELAGDVDVDLLWEAPDGTDDSGILSDDTVPTVADTGSCTTANAGTDEGTCTVTVRSPDGPGTGTLSVTSLEGEVVKGENLVVDYHPQSEVDDDPELDGPVEDATKTWWDYRVDAGADAVNLTGDPHTFTVTVERTADGTEWEDVPDGTWLDATFTGDGQTLGNECNDPAVGTTAGECQVEVTSAAPGTGTLVVTKILGTTLEGYELENGVEQPFTFDAGDAATKDWIAYTIELSDDATNLVDDPHVFTVTVTRHLPDGEGGTTTAPVGGGEVDLSLAEDSVGTISATSNGEVAGDGRSGTCTTSLAGTCAVTVDSDEVGETTLRAEFDGTALDSTGTMTVGDDATKTWIDYRIDVDDDAINAVGDPHTFTFSLVEVTPDGEASVTGAELDIDLDGAGSITGVQGEQVDGEPPVRDATCTTDTDGDCTVTFTSDEPGTTLMSASYLAEVAGTERAITSPDVRKDWAAIGLVKEAQIEPDEDGIKSVVLDEGESENVTYEYTITNLGPVALDVTSLVDDVLGTVDLPADLRLEPGASTTVEADDTISSDVNSVTNTGVVTGEAADGTQVTAQDVETVFVTEVQEVVLEPGVSVEKSVVSGTETDADGNPFVSLREGESATVGYEFLVTNTGDDVLVDLTLVDDKIGDLSTQLREAALAEYGVAALPVDGSVVVSAAYDTTAGDFEGGSVTNVVDVVAIGSDSGETVTDDDEATVFISEVQAEVLERPLPRTGADSLLMFLLGLLTATMGLAVLLLTRQGRRE